MSNNVIRRSVHVGKIIKYGVEIALEVAVETAQWKRPSSVARAQGPALMAAVEHSTKPLPLNTRNIISRETNHKRAGSSADLNHHITAIAYDADDVKIETIHLDTPEITSKNTSKNTSKDTSKDTSKNSSKNTSKK